MQQPWILALLLHPDLAGAANPLIKDVSVCASTGGPGGMCGVADPNLHFFNGSFYLFATHDYSINNTGFRMDDWQVWFKPPSDPRSTVTLARARTPL